MNAPTGIVDGLPDAEYHGRKDSLSQSGAKLLLPPNCPALYRYLTDNPPKSKPHFDFGHAAHKEVLGRGAPIRYVPYDSWRTKAAQQAQDNAYEAGEIPLLEEQRGVLEGMVAALRAHPLAAALFDPSRGKPEQSLFVTDHETGVNLRGRLDWLPLTPSGRIILPDYKTTINANPADFGRTAANLGYHQQDSWYRHLVMALGMDDDPAFLFVLQEKTPPYLVSVVELDYEAKTIGHQLNRQAIDIYQRCVALDEWPGYGSGVSLSSLPVWYTRRIEQDAA